jgi:hypothetical protein
VFFALFLTKFRKFFEMLRPTKGRYNIFAMATEEVEAYIRKMLDDPDAVREELHGELIAERGWAWYWSNVKSLNNRWIAACELDGFPVTKKATGPIM